MGGNNLHPLNAIPPGGVFFVNENLKKHPQTHKNTYSSCVYQKFVVSLPQFYKTGINKQE
jgi:hypothetical protein